MGAQLGFLPHMVPATLKDTNASARVQWLGKFYLSWGRVAALPIFDLGKH
jgi:hypothetical protein